MTDCTNPECAAREAALKAENERLRAELEDTRESQRQRIMGLDCHYGGGFVAPRQRCGMGDFRRANCARHYTDAVLERAIAVCKIACAVLAGDTE